MHIFLFYRKDLAMQSTEIMSGFSDLKDILISTYKIELSKNKLRLYFSLHNGELFMHDHQNHARQITLSPDIRKKFVGPLHGKKPAQRLVKHSLEQENPADFLNDLFLLNGFF